MELDKTLAERLRQLKEIGGTICIIEEHAIFGPGTKVFLESILPKTTIYLTDKKELGSKENVEAIIKNSSYDLIVLGGTITDGTSQRNAIFTKDFIPLIKETHPEAVVLFTSMDPIEVVRAKEAGADLAFKKDDLAKFKDIIESL